MKNVVFSGSCTAIITPMKNGEVDYESFEKLIEYQILGGTDALVVLGTTGEPSTLSNVERDEIIIFAKEKLAKRAKFIVGTGANDTKKAVEQSRRAQELGADALLVVTPYYNKCTQSGLVEHYQAISNAVAIPIIVYNVPSRTGVNILPESAVKLAEIDNVCGIKEACSDIAQIMTLCKLLRYKMAVYSGDDSLNFVLLLLGARGVISVTANVLPQEIKRLTSLVFSGNLKKALEQHERLLSINKNLFIEVNPIPVKFACSMLGLCENELRLPLSRIEESHKQAVINSLKEFKKF